MGARTVTTKLQLEVLILKSGKSIAQLAKESNVDARTIYEMRHRKYVAGPRDPSLVKLAKALDVAAEELRDIVAGKRVAEKQRAQDEAAKTGS